MYEINGNQLTKEQLENIVSFTNMSFEDYLAEHPEIVEIEDVVEDPTEAVAEDAAVVAAEEEVAESTDSQSESFLLDADSSKLQLNKDFKLLDDLVSNKTSEDKDLQNALENHEKHQNIGYIEEELATKFNETYAKWGFDFESSGMGDYLTVSTNDTNREEQLTKEFSVGNSGALDQEGLAEMEAWMKANKKEKVLGYTNEIENFEVDDLLDLVKSKDIKLEDIDTEEERTTPTETTNKFLDEFSKKVYASEGLDYDDYKTEVENQKYYDKELKLIGEIEKGAEAVRDVSGKARGDNSYQSYVDNYKASEEDIKEFPNLFNKDGSIVDGVANNTYSAKTDRLLYLRNELENKRLNPAINYTAGAWAIAKDKRNKLVQEAKAKSEVEIETQVKEVKNIIADNTQKFEKLTGTPFADRETYFDQYTAQQEDIKRQIDVITKGDENYEPQTQEEFDALNSLITRSQDLYKNDIEPVESIMKGIDYAGAEVTHLAELGNQMQLILNYDNLRNSIDKKYVDDTFEGFLNYAYSQASEGRVNQEFYKFAYGVNDVNNEEDLANASKKIALEKAYSQGLLTTKVFSDYQNAQTVSEQMQLLGQNPIEIMSSLFCGSMSQFWNTGSNLFLPMVGGAMATGIGVGAVAGAPAGGVGAIPGGISGGISGFKYGMMGWNAITGYSMEMGAAFSTVAGQNNVDLTDQDQVIAMLKNPELVAEAEKLGHDRGVPIGLMSIIGSAAAGAVAKPLATGYKAIGRQIAAGMVIDPITEGIGETLAMVNAGEELKWTEVTNEMLGGQFGKMAGMKAAIIKNNLASSQTKLAKSLTNLDNLVSGNYKQSDIEKFVFQMVKKGRITNEEATEILENSETNSATNNAINNSKTTLAGKIGAKAKSAVGLGINNISRQRIADLIKTKKTINSEDNSIKNNDLLKDIDAEINEILTTGKVKTDTEIVTQKDYLQKYFKQLNTGTRLMKQLFGQDVEIVDLMSGKENIPQEVIDEIGEDLIDGYIANINKAAAITDIAVGNKQYILVDSNRINTYGKQQLNAGKKDKLAYGAKSISHEILHAILDRSLADEELDAAADSLFEHMEEESKKETGGITAGAWNAVKGRLIKYAVTRNKVLNDPNSTTEGKNAAKRNYNQEVFTNISDAINDGDLKYERQDKSFWQGMSDKLTDFFKYTLNLGRESIDYESLKTPEGAFNFIKNYNSAFANDQGRRFKRGITNEAVLDRIAKESGSKPLRESKASDMFNELPGERNPDGSYKINKKKWDRSRSKRTALKMVQQGEFDGLLGGVLLPGDNIYNIPKPQIINTARGLVQDHVNNFNPEENNSLWAWTNSQIRNKVLRAIEIETGKDPKTKVVSTDEQIGSAEDQRTRGDLLVADDQNIEETIDEQDKLAREEKKVRSSKLKNILNLSDEVKNKVVRGVKAFLKSPKRPSFNFKGEKGAKSFLKAFRDDIKSTLTSDMEKTFPKLKRGDKAGNKTAVRQYLRGLAPELRRINEMDPAVMRLANWKGLFYEPVIDPKTGKQKKYTRLQAKEAQLKEGIKNLDAQNKVWKMLNPTDLEVVNYLENKFRDYSLLREKMSSFIAEAVGKDAFYPVLNEMIANNEFSDLSESDFNLMEREAVVSELREVVRRDPSMRFSEMDLTPDEIVNLLEEQMNMALKYGANSSTYDIAMAALPEPVQMIAEAIGLRQKFSAEAKAYKIPLINWKDYPEIFKNIPKLYKENYTKAEDEVAMKQMLKFVSRLSEVIDPRVAEKLGISFFGFTNRYLDAAASKQGIITYETNSIEDAGKVQQLLSNNKIESTIELINGNYVITVDDHVSLNQKGEVTVDKKFRNNILSLLNNQEGEVKKTGKIEGAEGKYYQDSLKVKQKMSEGKLQDLDWDVNDNEIYNSGFGIMGEVEDILILDIPVDDYTENGKVKKGKRSLIEEKLGDRIRNANTANSAAMKYVYEKIAEVLAEDPSLGIGFVRWQESATNNTKAQRGMTTLDLLQVQDGSQAAFVSRDGKKFKKNLAGKDLKDFKDGEKGNWIINKNHPDYQAARQFVENNVDINDSSAFAQAMAKALSFKGEHVTPSANLMRELAQTVLTGSANMMTDENSIYQLKNNLNDLLSNFSQSLGSEFMSAIQDKVLGETSVLDDLRAYSLSKEQQDTFITLDGTTGSEYVRNKAIFSEVIKSLNKQQDVVKPKNETFYVATKPLRFSSNDEVLNSFTVLDKAADIARTPNAPVKKIRVFDFDDTLARTKSNVLYTMPDGTTGKLTAEEFAKKGDAMVAEGVKWDFSEFNKVMEGQKGPLFEVAQKIQEARGTKDVFVLTARSQEAAPAIKQFLDSIGLNIPAENITGLGNSSPYAKSNWIVDKAAEGYNDFYFADDHLGNVKAVKEVLSQVDVKSKVQQAKLRFSENIDVEFNEIIENATGIESFKDYSDIRAKTTGDKRRKWSLIPPSAEDFVGLLYPLLGKGKKGDATMQWFKDNLLEPYARAMNDLNVDQARLVQDYKAIKKLLKDIPKNLRKKAFGDFTYEQVVRAYTWHQQGIDIDGLSKRDLKEILSFVEENPELKQFSDQLISINKGDGYSYPGVNWLSGTITTDLIDGLRTGKRAKYLQQWKQNVDLIFSKKNLNKLEAAYGPRYREALENIIGRMESGKNRDTKLGRLENRLLDFLNNSVGTVMFLNARSAVLQTLSSINFLNWSDNNPLKAGQAFANQPQYWSDFMRLMNSEYLVGRRNGLKLNVSESEIAEAANTSQNKIKGVISFLLKKGFVFTQIADSFAIATGGATFYRNRINTYLKQGMTQGQAEVKAFTDFYEKSEESQQSSRPDRISQQQASPLGRIIMAFANTPAQYARIQKKAILDLANGRGDYKENISKIIYYGVVQNLIFNALQQSLFALAFDDEEEDEEAIRKLAKSKGISYDKAKEKLYGVDEGKNIKIANGMLDSILRGLGIGGAVISTIKNLGVEVYDRSKRKKPEYADAAWRLLDIAPPLDIKVSKLKQAANEWDYNRWKPSARDPWNIKNPAYKSAAYVVSALTNVPLDRLFKKVENVSGALESEQDWWKRIALLAGWSEWELRSAKEKAAEKDFVKRQKAAVREFNASKGLDIYENPLEEKEKKSKSKKTKFVIKK